jgi:hypothetical protein
VSMGILCAHECVFRPLHPKQQLLRLKAHLKALADIHEKKQVRWITDNCEPVPEGLWQSSTSKSSTSTVLLYDCGTRSR